MPSGREPARAARVVEVQSAAWISSGLVRIVFTGAGLSGFELGAFSDHYVKLNFPPPGAAYGPPFDPAEIRATAPREQWPRTRTYTVREWDAQRGELTLDFVVHGEDGVAGPWARTAQAGDRIQFVGPGGGYRPEPEIGTHLFVGDESALPAIAVSLERLTPAQRAIAVLQVPGVEHRIDLSSPASLSLGWLTGSGEDEVLNAVAALELPPGDSVQAFVHGEAALVRAVRRHLLVERGLSTALLSASGYWKRDRTDEGWREDKAEWKRLVSADVPGA